MAGLSSINLQGLGKFTTELAGFEVSRYGLARDWDYVLGDERLFWRIHHNGKGYIQENPPGGTYWTRAGGAYDLPPWMVLIVPDGKAGRRFTNFRGSLPDDVTKGERKGTFACRWSVGRAEFRVRLHGLEVQTRLGVASSVPAALMRVKVTNRGRTPRLVAVMPRIKPWLTSAQPAAWEMPWLYQSVAYDPAALSFLMEMRNPGGDASKRRQLRWILDRPLSRLCLNEAEFVGAGTLTDPAALTRWGEWAKSEACSVYGESLFAALCEEIELGPGESWELGMALSDAREPAAGVSAALGAADEQFRLMEEARSKQIRSFQIECPDKDFTRYVNEYLALQELIVLRRGWPCNMMGVRDSGQDYTAAVAWRPEATRPFILALLETERSDGWFLRQFSTEGRHGKHDDRPYVDSGLWVWELVYEYICQTRDFSVLDEKAPFLDQDTPTSVLDHLGRLLRYFMTPENIGEHGLCKIREGDWNDSANRAGLQGRGESVMVSCHLIFCLREAAKLGRYLGVESSLPSPEECEQFAVGMRAAVRKAALNARGFLNGVFSDNGHWFFSDRDPDGKERFNVPVNSFGLIAGVFETGELETVCERIRGIRRSYGYPLFTPALGDPPLQGLGRIASGDLKEGLAENGACYNHGCHGFLARALAEAGQGDMFYDVMLCLLPYDQTRHPVTQAKTTPFAIVNVYKAAPGREGEGGDTFFSGTIPVAVRNAYQGMLGVHAEPKGLRIRPCFPAAWAGIGGRIVYAGKPLEIQVRRKGAELVIRVDGKPVKDGWYPAPTAG